MDQNNESGRLDRTTCQLAYGALCESLFDSRSIRRYKHPNRIYSHLLFRLECFVDDLITNDEVVPFVARFNPDGTMEYDSSHIAVTYFRLISDFINVVHMLSPIYIYNEHISIFTSCCRSLGLLNKDLNWTDIHRSPHITYPENNGVSAGELFNRLVRDIRRRGRSEDIKEKTRTRREEANQKFEDYCLYENALFSICANLVVLRTDLYYKKELAIGIDIHEAIKDLNHLLANRRCNSIFRHVVGYIAKIEYAVEKKVHIHLLVFLDGSKRLRTSHVHFAKQIGEYWIKTITKGRGDYWNSNARINDFIKLGTCGIGPIHANDAEQRQNLRNIVIRYLCKTDQFFRPRNSSGVKLIRRGQFPVMPKNKPGRARHISAQDYVGVAEMVRKRTHPQHGA